MELLLLDGLGMRGGGGLEWWLLAVGCWGESTLMSWGWSMRGRVGEGAGDRLRVHVWTRADGRRWARVVESRR